MIYAAKQGATATRVPLRDHRYDLDALADAIGPRTKIVYVCLPNNPTGTANTRAELDAFLQRVPEDVLPVVDQAYFEYVEDPDYPDAIAEHFREGRRVVVLRTFSKIYGLAGLRVGYAVGPFDVCEAMAKVRRPFDVSTTAQVAALASLDDGVEVTSRRVANRRGLEELTRILVKHGLEPAPGAVANFVYVEIGEDTPQFFERLLEEGVIVRPLGGFGASDGDSHLGGDAGRARVPGRGTRPHPALAGVGRERGHVLGDPLFELRVAGRALHPEGAANGLLGGRCLDPPLQEGREPPVLLAAERQDHPVGCVGLPHASST